MINVDLSQVLRWRGRLTGVPRVEYELALRFLAANEPVQFVQWQDGRFVVVPNAQELLKSRDEWSDASQAIRTAEKPQRKRIASAISRIPLSKTIYRAVRSVLRGVGTNTAPSSIPECVFEAGDTVFIGQGVWSDDVYADKVVEAAAAGANIVQIVYDMLPIIAPHFSGHSTKWLRNYAGKVYPVSKLLLSISMNTTRDVKQWLGEEGLHVPAIREFRLGEDFSYSRAVKPPGAPAAGQFILCVGTVEARKNHALLYYVYKRALEKNVELPKLVILGRPGWHTENVLDMLKNDSSVNRKIVLMENASDEELSWLYSNCRFTVYPSFYEGWGLPISESLYYGKPCICSNTSSMPEIAGERVGYFSPNSPDEALDRIVDLLDDKKYKKAVQKIDGYAQTSWDESFAQVSSLMKQSGTLGE